MELPALRQPKFVKSSTINVKKRVNTDTNYVILTLKNGTKLVVASDSYHGIVTEEEMYRCAFCATSVELEKKYLEFHKNSPKHRMMMADIPYIENFDDHLMRQLNKMESYCTICNVVLPTHTVARHIGTDTHTHEFDKATARGLEYKPLSKIT
ncbi:hypothetical protein NE865_08186 [Phthorimaea operculella]|nr:hypothetical protein NE865_08186 [Phthorimaea operculella]